MNSGKRKGAPKRTASPDSNAPGVTLAMVAREAGVSPSTVSRILNGTARVKESKVRAVREAISKLRFSPNPVARSLARGKSMNVGVVIQAISSQFYGEALAAIEAALFRADYSALFLSGHWREADERRCIEHLLGRRVEGIILMTSCLPDAELVALSRRVPVVLTGRKLEGERICSLDTDSTPGARLAVEHLIELGHRKIAFIAGPADHPDAMQRLDGYREALAAHRIPFSRKRILPGDYSEWGGLTAMNRILDADRDVTAVFAANDQTAYGAILALYRRGLRVPQDMSVVGFDDLPASSFSIPPLTTVHRFTREIGEGTVDALMDMIEGHAPDAYAPAAALAIRESTRAL